MGTGSVPDKHHKLSPLCFLPLFFALLFVPACGILEVGVEKATPVGGDPVATVSALATEDTRLATQVAALATANARQAAQVAALATANADQATQVAALPTESARQAALATANADRATQVAALATANADQAAQVVALATDSARQAAPATTLAATATAEPWQWASAGSMTTARVAHTATLLRDGRVLLVGGFTTQDPSTASAEDLRPGHRYLQPNRFAQHWTPRAQCHTPARRPGACRRRLQ